MSEELNETKKPRSPRRTPEELEADSNRKIKQLQERIEKEKKKIEKRRRVSCVTLTEETKALLQHYSLDVNRVVSSFMLESIIGDFTPHETIDSIMKDVTEEHLTKKKEITEEAVKTRRENLLKDKQKKETKKPEQEEKRLSGIERIKMRNAQKAEQETTDDLLEDGKNENIN
jgi:hypothetical protein